MLFIRLNTTKWSQDIYLYIYNSFDNQGSKIKNPVFLCVDILSFTKAFFFSVDR